ncbi:hypothetical protein ACIO3O_08245 [Streptomyces sp. NPDC087440]|uniref:hypothetical protein n=1 Tax=Streptomyces sp. NPDC087440 TaxID=3365790 RepID=UPI00382CE888
MPQPEFDLRLDGFDAADARTEEAFGHAIGSSLGELTPLAQHHSEDGTHSYYVLHDGSVTWGIPGSPQLVALHLQRDLQARTYSFLHAVMPLPVMAQSWLVRRGCPQDAIGLVPGLSAAADEATRTLEQQLLSNGRDFVPMDSYTHDAEPMSTLVVLRARDPRNPVPYRVLHEELNSKTWTHTLREGGFATAEEAFEWYADCLGGEAGPLPPVTVTAPTTRPAKSAAPSVAPRTVRRSR